jgi:hypothetical protein
MRIARAATVGLAGLAVAVLLWIFARRIGWPYDLEWMEGGMLCHSLRFLDGKPLYGPPSVDFIPYLYTPLYPWLVATLGRIFGVGYVLGRVISLLSYGGACALVWVYVRRETNSRAAALVAIGIPAAAFVPTGAWHDLARPDSLFLFLTTAGLLVGWWARARLRGGIAAALLLVAAFFTKQTASPFIITLGVVLLIVNWRTALAYGTTLVVVGLPLLWVMNRATDGWFWTYVFRLHQSHLFYAGRAFLGSPVRLILLLGPGLLLIPWALLRARTPGLVYAVVVGAAGAAVACIGFGTQWAFPNAFVPGVFFLALAIGVALGRLIADGAPRNRPVTAWLLCAATLMLAPGFLLPRLGPKLPRDWAMDAHTPTGYDPRSLWPTPEDRRRGDELMTKLRAIDGEVLIPFHPFYAHLVGKRTFVHRMGVHDVLATSGPPRDLVDAIQKQRFSAIVMDYKIDGTWDRWPGILQRYRVTDHVSGPRTFSGAETAPRDILTPIVVEPPREP